MTANDRPANVIIAGRNAQPVGGMDATTEAVPWGRYLDALRRYWWIVVIVLGAGVAVGRNLKNSIAPTYTAEATIFITTPRYGSGVGAGGPIRAQQVLGSSSWESLIREYDIIDAVVRRLSLNISFAAQDSALRRGFALDTTFQAGQYTLNTDSAGHYSLVRGGKIVVERGTVGDSIGRSLGFLWDPPPGLLTAGRVVQFSVSTVRNRSRALRGQLTTSIPGVDGQFMMLSLSGTNPRLTRDILNEWVKQFVGTATAMKKGGLTDILNIQASQLSSAEQRLVSAEERLRSFRENHATELQDNPGGGTGNTSQYFQLISDRDQIRSDRTALQNALKAVSTAEPTQEAYLAAAASITSPQLRDALNQAAKAQADVETAKRQGFADNSPPVQTAIAARDALLKGTIPSIANSVIASLNAREADVRSKIDTLSTGLKSVPARALEEQRLRRDYTQADQLYSAIKADYERNRLADAQTMADVKIQELAETPNTPGSNNGPRLFILAIVGSFGLGVGIALLLDRLDRRFRHPEQATVELGLTIIGTVPKFRASRRGTLAVPMMSQVVESFRALRLSVRHHFPGEQPVVLCVSSPGSGEGKSLVASNLAIAFANTGHRTLLVDGDVRRGVVHTTFGLPRRPGLVDYLAGTITKDKIISLTSTENLSVITSGARSRRSPELLVSDRMASLINELRHQYDVLIVDAPPFLAGMDAYALSAACGAMLVVLRPGVTDRKLAALHLETLDRMPIAVIGAVINGISANSTYRYYYRDYSDYASEEIDEDLRDEPEVAKPRIPHST